MKGISPIIAVILLIAVTVAIAGLISGWFTSLFGGQTENIERDADVFSRCASNTLTINEIRYTSGGTRANVTITAGGSQVVKNVTITIVGGGASTTSIKFFNQTGDDMEPGRTFATSISTSGGATLPPEIVTVSGLCRDTYVVAGTCKTGDPCMKSV